MLNNLAVDPAALLAMGGAILALALVAGVALYVYLALVLSTIAKKLDHPNPWLAWIPFANIALVLQMGNFHWAWIFLILVPFVGAIVIGILATIAAWRIFEKRKYPGWLALIGLPVAMLKKGICCLSHKELTTLD